MESLSLGIDYVSVAWTTPFGNVPVWGPPPVAVDDVSSTLEETPITIDILANDRPGTSKGDDDDDDDANRSFRIDRETVDLNPDANGIQSSVSNAFGFFSANNDGQVFFRPANNFFGKASLHYTVRSRANETSNRAAISIDVSNVNDAPVITGPTSGVLHGKAGEPVSITLKDVAVSDPDHDPSELVLTVLTGENYSVSGNAVTPHESFSGELPVNIVVGDGQDTSEPFTLRIQVAAKQNQRPTITGQAVVTTLEDEAVTITDAHLHVSDADDSWPGDFTIAAGQGANYSLSGLTVTPVNNFTGELSVPVTVNDGENSSDPYPLKISVTPVNDPPVITGQVALSTPEAQGIAIDLSHLTITDPDNSSFTLSILAGNNYTVSGNLVTPAPGFNGDITVGVFVSDGVSNSNQYPLVIAVTAVNNAPVITGQRAITVAEETAIGLSLADVVVDDPDDTFPEGFSLTIQPGNNYSFSGNTVTPANDFNGELRVNVVVNDGAANSAPFALLITVTPVNDAPVITGQADVSTTEETQRIITMADLVVSDPDNNYPEGFALLVFAGDNYALEGHTIVPSPEYSGILRVPVQVSDGLLNSNVFELLVNVLPANDKPVITGQTPAMTPEDVPFTIELAHLIVLDTDNVYPQGFTLTVSPGPMYTVSGTTVQPATDFNGTLNVSVSVSDGVNNSDPFAFQIQVGNANDAPTITGQASVSTDEEQPVVLNLSHLIVTDPDNTYPAGFTLLISPGTNYTVDGQTITPALNFAGMLTVPVRVSDGENNSPSFDFQLQVNQINDPPSFDAIPDQQIAENATAGSITITGISKGPLEADQQLTFVATSGNTNVIADPVVQYNGTASTAVLSYRLKPNASGIVTLTVVAIDNGGNISPHQNSYSTSFQVEVVEVNNAPTLDPISKITILEDAEQQNVTLSGISAGPGETQPLTVAVAASKPEFFEFLEVAYTSPATTGLLQFKTKKDAYGVVQLDVTVKDNGSGVAPHSNSITRRFSVEVQPVNDAPVFTSEPLTLAVVGESYEYKIETFDPDGNNVSVSSVSKPSWASLSGGSNGNVRLHGKPPPGALGNADVVLRAADGKSTVDQRFTIYINVRPELQNLTAATEEDVALTFPGNFFTGGYSDQNDNPLEAIQIAALPTSGVLTLSALEIEAGDTISASSLSQLIYTPDPDYSGSDSFAWKAFDGYHFSKSPGRVDLSIVPVNDPPRILLVQDTLHYEVDGNPAFLAPDLDIEDPDDDTLTRASIRFHPATYRPQMDILEFEATANIRGQFNLQNGSISFNGTASLEEYRTVLRSIRYTHLNTLDPILEPKGVSYAVYDGTTEGEPVDKVIGLQYTFVEFDIPTAFTPNGDRSNDTWIIDRPGGGLEEMDNAVISVYNKHGVLVFRTTGFGKPWDGTLNGEPLPADTYFFTIDLQLRNKKTYKGIVTILR